MSEMLFPALALWQKWKRTDIHALHAATVISLGYCLVVAPAREEDISAYHFLARMFFSVRPVVDGITIAVHLVYGISWWIVAALQLSHLVKIALLDVLVKTVVANDTILGIIEVCQQYLLAVLA